MQLIHHLSLMQKKQNVYLGILLLLIVLFLWFFFLISPEEWDNQTWEKDQQTVEKPVNKEKIIAETFGQNPQIEDIFALQDILGGDVIVEIDCDIINDTEAKEYCVEQKVKYEDFFNELTWWEVVMNGPEYIANFDCYKIVAEAGQEKCWNYKNELWTEYYTQ